VGEESVKNTVYNVCNLLNSPQSTRTPLLTSPCCIPEIPHPIFCCRGGLVPSNVRQPGADGELSIQHTCWMDYAAHSHCKHSWWPRGDRFGALLPRILDLQSSAAIARITAPPAPRPSKDSFERGLLIIPERFYRHPLSPSRVPSDLRECFLSQS
jgi:hypothetical protein